MVKTIAWSSGGLNYTGVYPWKEFLTNTYIENKIKNFAMMRGNLHLKFVLAASPFVYGATLVSYTPVPTLMTDSIEGTVNPIQNSQKPHVWLFPQNSEGGEMVLPFFWPHQYVDLSLEATLEQLGLIRLNEVISLDTANDAAIPTLTIQVYAWLEDVMLEGPTSALILQVGTEYTKGPVERISTAIASAASAVKHVPILAPFAIATEIGASAISSISSIFGWSKVIPVKDLLGVKNLAYGDWMSSEKSEAGYKFALDPKSELSVDPRIVNLNGEDELVVTNLVQKECYMVSSNWLSSDAAGTTLFRIPISPMLMDYDYDSGTETYSYYMSPMAYFAHMFQYWRGDIQLRFQLVASQYHRGRIKLTFDPHGDIGTGDYTNVAITKIVDITEDNDVIFTIPYMQEEAWSQARVYPPVDYGKGSLASPNPPYTNGTVKVEVLTPLSSPQATPSCHIMMFVRGGPNLELAVPRSLPNKTTLMELQVGEESGGTIVTQQVVPERFRLHFGERVNSLRQLLARNYVSQEYFPFGEENVSTLWHYDLRFRRVPNPPGYCEFDYLYSESIETPYTNKRFTFSVLHPIQWVSACFAAQRGGIQTTLDLDGCPSQDVVAYISRRLGTIPDNSDTFIGSKTLWGTLTSQQTTVQLVAQERQSEDTTKGVFKNNFSITPSVTFEATDQHSALFYQTRQEIWLRGSATDDSNTEYFNVDYNGYYSANDRSVRLVRSCCIAPDFNLHFFVCTPTVYSNENLYRNMYVS